MFLDTILKGKKILLTYRLHILFLVYNAKAEEERGEKADNYLKAKTAELLLC